ncbi:hypothetical protein K2173_009483 [Erythroxylum novogranatense]|uniref:Peptidase A1 domain-containing protein n=1 Tax=Erythroxylum novogranatense TaxID=1862640 RepID=A0AAV8U415_9ROSI|nr:hypothetical protein K2173_009483 [Erythroxylum novogranatense]
MPKTKLGVLALEPMPLFPLLFLLLLAVPNGLQCSQEKKVLSLEKFQWKQKSHASSCIPQKSKRENGATILEMKHRDSCSGGTTNRDEELQKRLILDNYRVQSLQSRMNNSFSPRANEDAMGIPIPLASGIGLQTLNYIVKVELGGRNMTVIVDTGSDLTWVQCQPCILCYNQQDPLFSPSTSASYQKVFCNTSTCQNVALAAGNSGVCGSDPPTCNYFVSYGDGSYTRGDLGTEHLKLGSTPVDKFIFGCGRNNKGLFGGVSGLLGLGRSDLSLVSQTSAIFEGVFSYCLPTTAPESSGSLVLGGNHSVYKNTTPISYTRMISNPRLPIFYFVNLTGIRVGGVALQATSFGILMDSGTVITRLPPSIYKALRIEFVKQFSGVPSAPAFSILDTCFDLSSYQEVDIPTIRLEFEGTAELNVDVTGIFYVVKTDASQVCMAIASLASDNEIGIIGNYQQRNQRVIYDTKASKFGFAEEACSFN